MDKDTEESTEQPNQKADSDLTSPILEPTIPEPLATDAEEPDDPSIHVTLPEIRVSESESKGYQIEDGRAESIGTDVQSEDEFKDIEVDLSEEVKNSDCQSVMKCETKASKTNSKMCSSKTLSPQLESSSSTAVRDAPTHQASDTTLSTSNAMFYSLAVSPGLVSIPLTSRDSSSGLAAEGCPRTRPTDFGSNLKQAIHVFHPRPPSYVLRRFPMPIHGGQYVYLRDSPESSDYGGSPDSIDDPFLMEDLESPENEMEDLDSPRKNETGSCSPPLLNPIGTDSSESGLIEGSIEDHPSDFDRIKTIIEANSSEVSRIEKTVEDNTSDCGHIRSTIGGFSFESDQIEGCTGDEPSESDDTNETISDLPSESNDVKEAIADLPSEVSNTENTSHDIPSRIQIEKSVELQSKSGQVEERLGSELEIDENIGSLLTESGNIESSTKNSSPELEQCKENIEDLSQSDNID